MGSRLYSQREKKRNKPRRRPRKRPKTYATEEAAKKAAEAQGLKDYKITKLKRKYRIDLL